jgi:hypothetical protein
VAKILLLCEFNWEEKALGNRVFLKLRRYVFFEPKFRHF